jgi:uncharacterized membrane protein YfcA
MDPLTFILGGAIGLVMGVTGAGGGVLAVPALLFGLHLSMQQAAVVSMVGVAVAASVGALEGLRRGVVRYRAAAVVALAGWPLSALGVAVAHRVSDLALRIAFVGVLAVVAWRQFGRTAHAEAEAHAMRTHVAELNPSTGRFVWTRRAAAGFVGIGTVTGFVSGLLGVGGGFVLVPLLSRLTTLNAPSLVGTSLMVTALVAAFGAAAAGWQGVQAPWSVTVAFTGALVAGMMLGRVVAHGMPEHGLRHAFALLVLGVGLAMAVDVARRVAAG